ncbi:hypothetical protein G5I_04429 [Acromyrmex echinatior]|uniref:Uncharacterized protein n=1 Tax=Acromyrmex echinatior TaxID=103372 RepID=F4WFM0_ACREC|nr:hypothetical protein G5I_04429 [Acromyrmex echinatior]
MCTALHTNCKLSVWSEHALASRIFPTRRRYESHTAGKQAGRQAGRQASRPTGQPAGCRTMPHYVTSRCAAPALPEAGHPKNYQRIQFVISVFDKKTFDRSVPQVWDFHVRQQERITLIHNLLMKIFKINQSYRLKFARSNMVESILCTQQRPIIDRGAPYTVDAEEISKNQNNKMTQLV